MNRIKKILISFLPIITILVMILDAKTTLLGAIDGVEICTKTIVPSLFPFFFLSGFLINHVGTLKTSSLSWISRICKMPTGTEPILLLGLVGGYPIGAEAISTAYHTGSISKQTAERMLGFCNNAGPAFIFGIAGSLFDSWYYPWIIWMIIILSAILTGIILPEQHHKADNSFKITQKRNPFDRAIKATAKVCGWVILFRVLIAVLSRWLYWMIPKQISVLITGFLELANGCIDLSQLNDPALKMIYATAMLSFGGLCVGLQTISVAKDLKCRTYFIGKTVQTLIATSMSCVAILFINRTLMPIPILVFAICFISIFCIRIMIFKNNSRKYQIIGV